MLSLLCQIYHMIGLIFIVIVGQLLKNNITIWLHCNVVLVAAAAAVGREKNKKVSLNFYLG